MISSTGCAAMRFAVAAFGERRVVVAGEDAIAVSRGLAVPNDDELEVRRGHVILWAQTFAAQTFFSFAAEGDGALGVDLACWRATCGIAGSAGFGRVGLDGPRVRVEQRRDVAARRVVHVDGVVEACAGGAVVGIEESVRGAFARCFGGAGAGRASARVVG